MYRVDRKTQNLWYLPDSRPADRLMPFSFDQINFAVMNLKYVLTSTGVMLAAALLWWCVGFLTYMTGGNLSATVSAVSFILTVMCALAYFRMFKVRTGVLMIISWCLCWFLLPEFSMSMSDRLSAFWNPNRVGFGGVTLMAITALLVGVISNSIGANAIDHHDNE